MKRYFAQYDTYQSCKNDADLNEHPDGDVLVRDDVALAILHHVHDNPGLNQETLTKLVLTLGFTGEELAVLWRDANS